MQVQTQPLNLQSNLAMPVVSKKRAPKKPVEPLSAFKSAILRIRDILRNISVCGMDSMRHICLYLLSRYMTIDKIEAFGIPKILAWENIMSDAVGEGGIAFAFASFYSLTGDSLVLHFDRLFQTNDFQVLVKSEQQHFEILKILQEINFQEIDKQIDVLGWVYEQHLQTGTSQSLRDMGQYFTDRSTCNYMIKLGNPAFKPSGEPETVFDPSMGTGGFLIAAAKHLSEGEVDWSRHINFMYGCDIDSRVAGVARLNLFLETGVQPTNILTHDSLRGETPTNYPKKFDVIMANMPFGIKGIKHKECCELIRDIDIPGTKAEPLFIQLCGGMLEKGGRAAIVIPDGILTNVDLCTVNTRKYVLENFELKRVIKMAGKSFMNTGIQPSILFFVNSGNPTSVIEFWKVERAESGDLVETLQATVTNDKLDQYCRLDVWRYMEKVELPNSSDFPVVALAEVLDLKRGKTNLDRDDSFAYPYYDTNGVTGRVAAPLYEGEHVITASVMSIGSVHYVNEPFYPSAGTVSFASKDVSVLSNRFFFYWLRLNNNELKIMSSGVKPRVSPSDMGTMLMQLPPLSVQEEIVDALDKVYANGTMELIDNLKKQKLAILRSSLFSQKSVKLSTILTSQTIQAPVSLKDAVKGGVALFSSSSECAEHDVAEFEGGAYLIVGTRGTISAATHFCSKPFSVANNVFVYVESDPAVVSLKFVYNFLYYTKAADKVISISVIPMLTKENFQNIDMPLPPLEVQLDIVNRLDALQECIDSLETLQASVDDSARFILNSYLA